MKKLALAALAGGMVLFAWGFAAWMLLPMRESTIKQLPNESAFVSSLQRANAPRGVYFFGGPDRPPGPQGLLVYTPMTEAMNGGQLARTFVFDVLSALAVAWLLSRAAAMSFARRVLFVILAGGVLAAMIVDLPNWNWFAYPGHYTLMSALDRLIGWVLAGVALAAIVKPQQQEMVTA